MDLDVASWYPKSSRRRPQLTDTKCLTSGDWSTQTTAAAVEKLRERGVEVELSCGRAEGGGIALASSFSFAREMREVRLMRG
ncbi:hypothetical protein YC2023_119599 [Brassica napus]